MTADAESPQDPVDMDVYYIVPDKCTECKGFHDEPQCAAVCPVDCCVDDEDWRESDADLLLKKDGKWKIIMEYQKSRGTKEEWDALKPSKTIPAKSKTK